MNDENEFLRIKTGHVRRTLQSNQYQRRQAIFGFILSITDLSYQAMKILKMQARGYQSEQCEEYLQILEDSVTKASFGKLGLDAFAELKSTPKEENSITTTATKERLPQRFEYEKDGRKLFGVCFPVTGNLWRIETQLGGFCSFDDVPWEVLGQVIGDVDAFRWIDNDFGWIQ